MLSLLIIVNKFTQIAILLSILNEFANFAILLSILNKFAEILLFVLILNGFARISWWVSAAVIHVAVVALSGYDYVVNHLYAKQFAALADTMSEVVVLCAGAK